MTLNRMTRIPLLLLLLLLPLSFCNETSDCRATLIWLQSNFFSLVTVCESLYQFQHFPSLALLSHAAKLPRVKGY